MHAPLAAGLLPSLVAPVYVAFVIFISQIAPVMRFSGHFVPFAVHFASFCSVFAFLRCVRLFAVHCTVFSVLLMIFFAPRTALAGWERVLHGGEIFFISFSPIY